MSKGTNITSKCYYLYCNVSFQTKTKFALMYGGHVFRCQSYKWSTTILHNRAQIMSGLAHHILCVDGKVGVPVPYLYA